MRLTTIGTGTAAPHPLRVQSSALIEAGAVRLLVDCGSGSLWRMAQLGLDWASVTHVAITHFHPDHTLDLVSLLMAWRYGMLPPRDAPITLVGPVGLDALVDRLAAATFPALRTNVPGMRIIEVGPHEPFSLGDDVVLEACAVPHTPESVAFGLTHRGRRLVCSGDTGMDTAFAEWASDASLLLLECSLPSAMAVASHLTPEQCGAMAAIASPGRLVLTHLYPPVERADIRAIVGERFGGPIDVANDGSVFLVT
ncbi:MAG: ribonuclease Z [Gemmatimonadaceae bacterium]|nr:ribonuclease Z [Gemmatimonadaceae bacterium]